MRAAVAAPSAARTMIPRLAPASARPSARPAIRRAPVRKASYHTAVVQASQAVDGADTMAVTFKLNRKVRAGPQLPRGL